MSYRKSPISPNTENTSVASTPANPTSGKFKLYFKPDGELYKLNSVGTETQLATGTGDHKFLVSIADTTADYLTNKWVVGSNLTKTILNPGANEQIQLTLGSEVVLKTTAQVLTNKVIIKKRITTSSASYSVLSTDEVIFADATPNNVGIHLEDPTTAGDGRTIVVKRVDNVLGNTVKIYTNSTGETIDGKATKPLAAQYDSFTLICDGFDWFIL